MINAEKNEPIVVRERILHIPSLIHVYWQVDQALTKERYHFDSMSWQ